MNAQMKRGMAFFAMLFIGVYAHAQQNEYYLDGYLIKQESKGVVDVSAFWNETRIGDFGYYRINLMIGNNGDKAFNYEGEMSAFVYNRRGRAVELKTWTGTEFDKRLKTFAMLEEGFSGFNAGVSGGSRVEQTVDQLVIEYNSAVNDHNRKVVKSGYFKKTTIFPGDYHVGYVMIEKKKGEQLEINMTIGGENFTFIWDMEDE